MCVHFSWAKPGRGIAGSYDKGIFKFILKSTQLSQTSPFYMYIPVVSYPGQQWLLSIVSTLAILVHVKWFLKCVVILILIFQ